MGIEEQNAKAMADGIEESKKVNHKDMDDVSAYYTQTSMFAKIMAQAAAKKAGKEEEEKDE